ncbi:hypothetical protein IQ225_19310, partial [Synechocystis salina LEGE 06155]|nr:hypothetical protein [Synechocystis salina LEGE 06155]
MAMTISNITKALDQEKLRYIKKDDSCLLIYETKHYCNPEGKKELVICFAIDEDGDHLIIFIPKAFSLEEETAIRGQVLKTLMARQYQKRYVRYEFDPRDGEVRLGIDLILEDNILSPDDLLTHLGILLKETESIYQEIQPLLHIESQVSKLEALYQQDVEPNQKINRPSLPNGANGDRPSKSQDKGISSTDISPETKSQLLEDFFEANLKPEQKQFLRRLANVGFDIKYTGAKKQTIRICKDGYDYGYINRSTISKGLFGYKFNVSPLLNNRRSSDHCPSSLVGEGGEKKLASALENYFTEKYSFYAGWYLDQNKGTGKFYVVITDIESAERI